MATPHSQALTAPHANGEVPVNFSFIDALRWVGRGPIRRLSLSRLANRLRQRLLVLINALHAFTWYVKDTLRGGSCQA